MAFALATVVGSGAAGWLAGTRIESSNEAAAAAAAPDPSAVTAAVKRMALSSNIVTRGTAQFGEPQKVSLPGSGLVTRAPEVSAEVQDGSVFMEVNGLPVFALEGDRPMYRDLAPGDSGEDVRQLEVALGRLGFDPGPIDGNYDGATAAAVDRWYASVGYAAEGPTDAERAELRGAASAVDQAEAALAAARRQLLEGTRPPTEIELIQSESELRQAQDALGAARAAASERVRLAEREATAKHEALQAAKDKIPEDELAARRLVEEKYVAAEVARANLSALRSGGGSGPDEAGPSQASLLQAQQAVKRADQELADARAARDRQPVESQQRVDDAQRALDDARAAIPRAQAEGESAIRNAETALTLAQLRLNNLRAPKTSESLAAAVSDATEGLARARATLAETQSETGLKVRVTSVVYFAELPLRVDAVKVKRGDPANGEIMTVSGGELVVDSAVSFADAKLLASGMTVDIEAPDLGIALKGRITRIADKPGSNGVTAQQIHIEIEPIEPPANFRDAAVKVTIPVKSTAGEVLAVPVAAVSSSADGSARVETVDAAGVRRQVKVTVGLSSQGLVEVAPVEGELSEHDRVVVGAQ